MNELGNLRQQGVGLLHRGLKTTTDADKDKWWQDIARWRTDIRLEMSRVRPIDPDIWETLGTYHLHIFNPAPYRGDMNDKLTQLSVWLMKLEYYIDSRSRL